MRYKMFVRDNTHIIWEKEMDGGWNLWRCVELTGYCRIAGQTRVTGRARSGVRTGYCIARHRSVTAGPAKFASAAPYKNESHKWDL